MCKISVIIPVYNAELHLHQCVDSLLVQTCPHFELLLIDDGSTDASSHICDTYAEKDSRVRVFHKSNGGVSSARNVGLDNARGEWIAFVDSDDSVSKTYLYNLLSHSRDVDLVISYAELVYSDNQRRKEIYESGIVAAEYDSLFIKNDLHWHTSPWSKLYKRRLCDTLRFIEGMHIGEDLVFLYTYMMKCTSIYVSSDTDYFYFVDAQGSLTKRINSLNEELLACCEVTDVVREIIKVKQIKNTVAISKLRWIIACYVRRVLTAIYYDGKNRNMFSRIKIIKSVDIDEYVNYIDSLSSKEHLYRLLLKYRLYVLYDLLRKFIVWIKR